MKPKSSSYFEFMNLELNKLMTIYKKKDEAKLRLAVKNVAKNDLKITPNVVEANSFAGKSKVLNGNFAISKILGPIVSNFQ